MYEQTMHEPKGGNRGCCKCFGADGPKKVDICGYMRMWINRDEAFLDTLKEEYCPRAAFYFAFLSTYATMNVPLAAASVVVLLLGYWLKWLNYLRLLGLLGMGTASIWCPAVVCRWRQRSNELLYRWHIRDTASARELLQLNPNYIESKRGWCSSSGFMVVLSILVSATAFIVVVATSFILIEADNALVTLPLCGSFFSQQQKEGTGGGLLTLLGVDCFESIDSSPNPAADRGRYCILSGIVAGLAIDLVYTNVFATLAYWMADQMNKETIEQKEHLRVRLLFPFEWLAFMSYFLLAALCVPLPSATLGWTFLV